MGKKPLTYFTDLPGLASSYAESQKMIQPTRDWDSGKNIKDRDFKGKQAGANVMPVYLSMKDPLIVEETGKATSEILDKHFKKARENNNDGVIFKRVRDPPLGE